MTEQTPSGENRAQQIVLDNLKTTYANVCRIAPTPNEVIIDFGMNPNFYGPTLDEPVRLDSRVIMNYETAKRLCGHLVNVVRGYEQRYGEIELDIAKRLRQPAAGPTTT